MRLLPKGVRPLTSGGSDRRCVRPLTSGGSDLLVCVLILFFSATAFAQSADLIIINANIRTMDKANPRAEAVAVEDGRIVAVGTTKTIQQFADKNTKVIDADGKLVLPGFNDAHVHFMAIGNLFSSADMSEARTADDVIAKLKHFARFLPKGRWILGSKLDASIELTREQIDAATPDNPVFIYSSDARSALVNKLSLQFARMSEPPLVSGGIVTEPELSKVKAAVPTNHIRDWPAIAEAASNYAASFGITSVQDTHSDDMARVYSDLNAAGKLKTRVYDCVSLSNWAKLATVGLKAATGNAMIRTGCVKGFYDPDDDETKSLAANVKGADASGLQVFVHAVGKDANLAVLDAFEKAIAANGPRDRRFRVEHANGLRPTDIARFGKSRIVPSMQPILFFTEGTGTTDDYRKMLDTSAPLAFGSDAPMRGFSPIEGIYAAVNAGGKRGITVEEAVYAYTLGAAYAEFQDKEKGSIEVGKLADLVILSDDIFRLPANDTRKARTTLVFLSGRVIYENN